MTPRVAIIGGGIAGVSAAAKLASLAHVTLYEAEPTLSYHATGRSAAMFLVGYGNEVVRALNQASEAELIAREVLSPKGVLMLERATDHAQFLAESGAMGLPEISISEAQSLLPILNVESVANAAYSADATAIDTDALVQSYLRQARNLGAVIKPSSPVKTLTKTAAGWDVVTKESRDPFDYVVNAAGAWADQIAERAGLTPLGITPYRRSMAQLPLPEGAENPAAWPFTIAAGERWYAKIVAGKWWVSPSEEDPSAPVDAFADDMVIAEGLARYEDMTTQPVTRVERVWAGLRSFAPDRALVLGPDPKEPSFLWCAGQGGYGFQTAPAASDFLAAQISKSPSPLPTETIRALSPSRFTS
ncbi:MAG: FAD-binding oxidoreductase [Pseudomonadota bacterium]